MLTSFLNLVNDDWLRRADRWMEALHLGAHRNLAWRRIVPDASAHSLHLRRGGRRNSYARRGLVQLFYQLLVSVAGDCWRTSAVRFGVGAGGRKSQSPTRIHSSAAGTHTRRLPWSRNCRTFLATSCSPPLSGRARTGKVWLARNTTGQWRAVKVVYLINFNNDAAPYEREFNGISRYQAISDKHPSLLRVDFVSEKFPGHFYYVMELGDPFEVGWEREPSSYKPRDLASERTRAQGGRLPTRECLRIGLELSDALDFLHRQGLTHRDIKPQNIIFVNGHPKLADLGLIAEIRPPDQKRTLVGTPGYMPPPPELPGTPQADIYALGIVLYVLSTGRNPAFFPEISTTIAENIEAEEFFVVNTIILKACQPDPAQRYASALEMHRALQGAQEALESGTTGNASPPVQ